jgi:hypothetical protein
MSNATFSLSAILGSFTPHRMHMRLSGARRDYDADKASLQHIATSVHEHMHFFQTTMTGYGHIAWESHRQLTSFMIHDWLRMPAASDGKRRLPLAHAAKLSRRHLAGAFIVHSTALESLNLGRPRFWLSQPGVTLAALSLTLTPHPWPANPTITVNGEEHVLQGKEIIEGHAQYVESTFLETKANMSREKAWDRGSLPKQYYVALDWFTSKCGEGARSDFPFLCDLSLQTSWNPVVPKTEQQWRASNPAWRFLLLTDAYCRTRRTFGGPSEWPAQYQEISGILLDAAGLAPLNQVLRERLEASAQKEHLLHFEALMRRALEFRLERPWCGGNPILDSDLWQLMMQTFPAPVVEIEGRLVGGGLGEPYANSESVFELHYQAFAAQLFGDFSKAAVQEKSIECAFARFDIPQGCEFQRTHYCTGRYQPAAGPPHPLTVRENGDADGCSFELLLHTMNLTSQELDLDHSSQMPSVSELAELG